VRLWWSQWQWDEAQSRRPRDTEGQRTPHGMSSVLLGLEAGEQPLGCSREGLGEAGELTRAAQTVPLLSRIHPQGDRVPESHTALLRNLEHCESWKVLRKV
jgi:hypothetical protein